MLKFRKAHCRTPQYPSKTFQACFSAIPPPWPPTGQYQLHARSQHPLFHPECRVPFLFEWFSSCPRAHRDPQRFGFEPHPVRLSRASPRPAARPHRARPPAGHDITMSQCWLMAVLSQGLMTSSLTLSFVSPMVSVSRQKREAMCSMCEPTLPQRWGETPQQTQVNELPPHHAFTALLQHQEDSCHQALVAWCCQVQGPQAHTKQSTRWAFFPSEAHSFKSASSWLQEDNILLTAFSPGHWFKCQLSD